MRGGAKLLIVPEGCQEPYTYIWQLDPALDTICSRRARFKSRDAAERAGRRAAERYGLRIIGAPEMLALRVKRS